MQPIRLHNHLCFGLFVQVLAYVFLLGMQPLWAQTVTARGYAMVIQDDVAMAKRSALEQALFFAAADAGLNVYGYTASDGGKMLADQVAIQPGGKILHYKIVDEQVANGRVELEIQADVQTKADEACVQNRKYRLTADINPINLPARAPYWLGDLLQDAAQKVVEEVFASPMVVAAHAPYAPTSAEKADLDYRSIMGLKHASTIGKVGHATMPATHRLLVSTNLSAGPGSEEFTYDLVAQIFALEDGRLVTEKRLQTPLKLGLVTPVEWLDVFGQKTPQQVRDELQALTSHQFMGVLFDAQCGQLEAILQRQGDRLIAPLGRVDGVRPSDLAFAEGGEHWRVMRVEALHDDHTVLAPLVGADWEKLQGVTVRFAGGS